MGQGILGGSWSWPPLTEASSDLTVFFSVSHGKEVLSGTRQWGAQGDPETEQGINCLLLL
jgi:hypothetical protein